jgi:amino acid adenylation domain-containing protein
MLSQLSRRNAERVLENNPYGAANDQLLLPQRIAAVARRWPQRTALVSEQENWSYAQLDHRAAEYAAGLVRRGSVPGSWVGICCARSPELVALLLGCWKAGAPYVPLDPTHPVGRIRSVLEDALPSLVVADAGAPADLPPVVPIVPLSELSASSASSDGSDAAGVRAQDLAYVIYTSGSTGRPKGVLMPHGPLAELAASMAGDQPGLSPDDVVLAHTTVAFDMSIPELFVPLTAGATVVLAGDGANREPEALLDLIERHDITAAQATPSLWQMLALAGLGTAGRRRVRAMTGGERLSDALAADLLERVDTLYNLYGPTETTTFCTFGTVTDPERIVLGSRMRGVRLYVLDDRLNVAPLGARGELYVGGTVVSQGYHRRPGLTAERFLPDPFSSAPGARMYRTGDLVRLREDATLTFLGRADLQVKVRGHRVELVEVDAALLRHPLVRQAAAVAQPDQDGTSRIDAYVAVADGAGLDDIDLREHLRRLLPEPMLPRSFVQVAALPLTPNGKVDRAGLLRLAGAEQRRDHTAPRSAAEQLLAGIWASVLQIEQVGATDDFFELGGDSLLAMQIVARLRAATGIDLRVGQLFQQRTLAELAATLEQQPAVARATPASLPLSPWQEAVWMSLPAAAPFLVQFELRGELQVGALTEAVLGLVQRHESLRTTFPQQLDDPVQVVSPRVEFDLDEVSLRGLEPEDRSALLTELATSLRDEPFDPADGPLVRVLLVELDKHLHRLLLCVHALVFDSWSRRLVAEELAALYDLSARGLPLDTLPLPRPARPQPGAARPQPPPERRRTFRHLRVPLPPRLSGQDTSRLLLATFADALHQTTGRPSLTIGLTASARALIGAGHVIGCMTTALAVRSRAGQAPPAPEPLRPGEEPLATLTLHDPPAPPRVLDRLTMVPLEEPGLQLPHPSPSSALTLEVWQVDRASTGVLSHGTEPGEARLAADLVGLLARPARR